MKLQLQIEVVNKKMMSRQQGVTCCPLTEVSVNASSPKTSFSSSSASIIRYSLCLGLGFERPVLERFRPFRW